VPEQKFPLPIVMTITFDEQGNPIVNGPIQNLLIVNMMFDGAHDQLPTVVDDAPPADFEIALPMTVTMTMVSAHHVDVVWPLGASRLMCAALLDLGRHAVYAFISRLQQQSLQRTVEMPRSMPQDFFSRQLAEKLRGR
jgi:hypothetical protein